MKRIAAILALGGLASPAFAGGPAPVQVEPEVYPAPAPVVAPRLGGEWGGAYGGLSLGYGEADGKAAGVRVLNGDGAIGGVQAGYRWDFGQTVLGVEGAWQGGDLKDDTTGAKLKSAADLKLQLGYDLGNSLIYATAGSSWAKAQIGGVNYSDNGWAYGVGYDYDLGNNWTLGGEYLRRDFGNFDKTGVDLTSDTLSLRANFRF